jgi:hypothetical protein
VATTAVVPGASATLNITIAQTDNPSAVPVTSLTSPPGARTIHGTIFETTADGRRPVPGAWVGWEALFDTVVADIYSDADGHYTLCGLPETSLYLFAERVGATGPSYKPTEVSVGPSLRTVDIELTQ